jgi:hypothetical protein
MRCGGRYRPGPFDRQEPVFVEGDDKAADLAVVLLGIMLGGDADQQRARAVVADDLDLGLC